MKHHDNLFSSSLFRSNIWTFNDQVTEVFEDMIKRSIPGYSSLVSMIALLTGRIVRAGTYIYDLGCSIGTTTIAIKRAVRYTDCRIIAVDYSPSMIHQCLLRLRTCDRKISTEVIEGDICDITIENASLVVLNFTLQFLPLERRQALLKNIYQGLNPGGCLVISEKFSFKNPTIDTLLFNMHHDFKRANGYSAIEIQRKHHILEKVMYTDSVETHKERLAEAGFGYSEIWFQQLNFGSMIAII